MTPEGSQGAELDAVRGRRFDVWVPRSQVASGKLAAVLSRPAVAPLLGAHSEGVVVRLSETREHRVIELCEDGEGLKRMQR